MEKREEAQFIVLGGLSAFFAWVYFSQMHIPNVVLDAALQRFRPFLLFIAGILWIPLISNLLLQTYAEGLEYDETKYYAVLRTVIHVFLLILFSAFLAIVFAYVAFYTIVYLARPPILAIFGLLVATCVLFLVIVGVGNFLHRKFNFKLFDVFQWWRSG